MQFRKWLLINEIVHKQLPKPMVINGVEVDAIDFRFEDWSKGLNPEKSGDGLIPKFNPSSFIQGDFSAPLKDGSFLNFVTPQQAPQEIPSGMTFKQFKAAGLKLGGSPEAQITISPKPEAQRLTNPFWWKFAVAYLNGQLVKEPEWPRGGETMVATQAPRKVASL